MSVLSVEGLTKRYPGFTLNKVSFALRPGEITGFIGRNGAGKTTTLKLLYNLIHPDAGEARFFDLPFAGNERMIKQQTGLVLGGIDYYPNKRIGTITKVTRDFYENWDDQAYTRLMGQFNLDERKTPAQLSAGMRVKYALVLALSHNARLLILDEPTSGLDPVSRDELLEIFMALSDQGITILFSTHITSDLDKCAANIIYIKQGVIVADTTVTDFVQSYRVVDFADDSAIAPSLRDKLIGWRRNRDSYSSLVKASDLAETGLAGREADLEAIMVHMEKEEGQ